MSNYLNTKLDADQVIRKSFDEENSRLRVDAQVTASIGTVECIIDATSGDNIAISDGIHTMAIEPDGSINVNTSISHTTDSIKIGDGSNIMSVNTDGSINTNTLNSFFTKPYDEVNGSYPNSITEIYTTKMNGVSQQMVTVTYTDSTKDFMASAIRIEL